MPLEKSSSDAARQRNIKRELAEGKPQNQAVAIGYSEQREARGEANESKKKALRNLGSQRG